MKIIHNNKLTILTSDPGFTLTQVSEVELSSRILAKIIYLGKYDLPENYKEIPDSDAERYMKELELLNKQEENPE